MLVYRSVTAKSSLSTAIFTSQGAGHKVSQQSLQLVLRPLQQLSPEFLWSFFFFFGGGGGAKDFPCTSSNRDSQEWVSGGSEFLLLPSKFCHLSHISSRFEQIYSLYFEIYKNNLFKLVEKSPGRPEFSNFHNE